MPYENNKEQLLTGDDAIYSPLVGTYLDRLEIEPVRHTRLINIGFVGYYPEIITKIANEHVQAYIDKNLELKFQATQDAISWLGKKLSDVKITLTVAENALQSFKEKEDIISLGDIAKPLFLPIKPKKKRKKILKSGLAHIIATDAHASTWRPPILSNAVRATKEIIGEDNATKMVTEIPWLIIQGTYC